MVYGDFGDFGWRENKANSKPISNAGSDAEWIPAFAGMTNMESRQNKEQWCDSSHPTFTIAITPCRPYNYIAYNPVKDIY